MPEAYFYQLMGDPPEAVLPRMLELALRKGWRVEVRGADRDRMERLDLALWGPGDDFLPHGLAGGPLDGEQPVLLTTGEGGGLRDCLMALDGAPVAPHEAGACARVCVIFDGGDPDVLATARAQWRSLTAQGLAARYYVREDGAWALRQERPATS